MDSKKRARILTLSASKIALWDTCQMAFFLRYIEHVKIPESVVLTFGKRVHHLLDHFYKVDFVSPESFMRFGRGDWFRTLSGSTLKGKRLERLVVQRYPKKPGLPIDQEDPRGERGYLEIGDHVSFGPRLEDGRTNHYNEKGRPIPHPKIGVAFDYMRRSDGILTRFHRRHKNKEPPIEREKRRTVNLFGFPVIVVFDRIDKTEDGWYLTDYKTGKKCPEDSFELHRRPQFTIYSKAFRQILGEKERNILYYHVESGKVLKTKRNEIDYDYLEALFQRISSEMEKAVDTGQFVPHYGYHCKFCDYKPECEKYSVSYDGPPIANGRRIIPAEEFTGWHSEDELTELLAEER
ncbi:MAG: PD-(D/E)XK nuclease family protein [archaeon]